jgi:hypothetical protein
VKEDVRRIIAFCVRVGENGVEEMVRKLECPVHTRAMAGEGESRGVNGSR